MAADIPIDDMTPDPSKDPEAARRFVWEPGDIRIIKTPEQVQEDARRGLEELNG